jgi:hypothetical protein
MSTATVTDIFVTVASGENVGKGHICSTVSVKDSGITIPQTKEHREATPMQFTSNYTVS